MEAAKPTQHLQRIALFSILLFTLLLTTIIPIPGLAAITFQTQTCEQAILHYQRRDANYDGWSLYVWGSTAETVTFDKSLSSSGKDDFGIYWVVKMNSGADLVNYIIHKGNEKDPGPDQTLKFADKGCEIWLVQGKATQYSDHAAAIAALVVNITQSPPPATDQVIIHYRRVKEDYDGWGLHIWGPTAVQGITWTSPFQPAGQDDYGLYWVIDMQPGATSLNYIVHKGDEKDPGPDQTLDITALGQEIWLIQGTDDQFTEANSAKEAMRTAGLGDIKNRATAHWLAADTIAWPTEFPLNTIYQLFYDPYGNLTVTPGGLQAGQTLDLEYSGYNLTPTLAVKYPYLWKSTTLKLPAAALDKVSEILKGQYAVSASLPDGTKKVAALQIAGVLDDLYAKNAANEVLGVSWNKDVPTLRVWAPTAKSVALLLFVDAKPGTKSITTPMTWEANTGAWTITGLPAWSGQYYLYDVEVFIRQSGEVVHNLVTDPYSLSLAMNSTRSQIVDLNDPALFPSNWDKLTKPALEDPTDIVIYELHLRDFSVNDLSVPIEKRGTYLAFADPNTNGMRHLKRLADAGVTHVHLLPVFDIATINENKSEWEQLDFSKLASYPPNSTEQQQATNAVRGKDGFNWGYDPLHYTTPEGSYATDPTGAIRIKEFRQMVSALNQIGLRVVMDVVYNHTNAGGQSDKSVLDRIVPGYYHRLDANGNITTSTCCANTATENAMMEKLMIDSLRTWAEDYKVDGFRFDLMGHHMVTNMENVRAMLDGLTIQNNGVEGKAIYVYGEGWNFGEVANGARGVNATQQNLGGTGIGTFNDRLRDAARGGTPFSDKLDQGFITGLYTDPNSTTGSDKSGQLGTLLTSKDIIAVSLAGNLAAYPLTNALGQLVDGKSITYNGQPAGYTQRPQENIVYVSAHDNESLFDAIQYKAPITTSVTERVRMQELGIDLVALSQGIPFFQAGDELLRSKSLDRDSYDSGDWFNKLDFTYNSNNWGAGLPPEDKNRSMWPVMDKLLGNPDIAPKRENILASLAHFEEIIRIRKSSPLFRLRSAAEIKEFVKFFNTGPKQIPGLIVMTISDSSLKPVDPNYDLIVVLFNADKNPVKYTLAELQDGDLTLHPIQANSADSIVRTATFTASSQTFSIPGRTTAVFVGTGKFKETAALVPVATNVPTPTPLVAVQPTQIPTIAPTQALLLTPVQTPLPQSSGKQPVWPWAAGGVTLGVGVLIFFLLRKKKV